MLPIRAQAPIYVAESVLQAAAFIPSEETESETIIPPEKESSKKPLSKDAKLAALQNKLREAIDGEEYERAAKIRDDIKRLSSDN